MVDNQKTPVTIIGNDSCPYCVNAKKYFGNQVKDKVELTWIDSDEQPQKRQEAKKKYNWPTIPLIIVNGQFTGGYSETMAKINSKQVTL